MKLPKYFGMPPDTMVSESIKINSMPILEIVPHLPKFQTGLSLFRLAKAWEDVDGSPGYHKLLKGYNFELDSTPIRIAFLADSFPSDSFTNEYSESFLNRATDVATGAAAELSQILGGRNVGQAVTNLATGLKKSGGMIGGVGSSVLETGKDIVQGLANVAGQLPVLGSTLRGGGTILSKLMSGARVDFPQIWRNSGFQPSYSVTCRLYNPLPGNKNSTEKYIIGPIAALLCLCLPQTEDGYTYSWPFLHKIRCRGLFDLRAAFISNITIIKGGDQQQIAWNQRLGIVDVRIDFGGLYASMLAGANNNDYDRTSLDSYLSILRDEGTMENVYKNPDTGEDNSPTSSMHKSNAIKALPPTSAGLAQAEKLLNINQSTSGQPSGYKIEGPGFKETVSTLSSSQGTIEMKNKQSSYALGGDENVTDTENFQTTANSRINTRTSSIANNLESQMPII